MILITADEYPFKPQFCHFAKAFHAGNKTTLLIIIVVMHLINPHNRVESLGGVNLMPAYSCPPTQCFFSFVFVCHSSQSTLSIDNMNIVAENPSDLVFNAYDIWFHELITKTVCQ